MSVASDGVEHPQIRRLVDCPGAVDLVARWHFDEWGTGPPEQGLDQVRERLASWATDGGVPCGYVAVVDHDVCGSASLVDHDMPHPPEGTEHLRPWLSGVFVKPDSRKTGLGPALVGAVESSAADLGFPTLYLFTAPATARKFYEPMGWEAVLTPQYEGREVVVMAKALSGRQT